MKRSIIIFVVLIGSLLLLGAVAMAFGHHAEATLSLVIALVIFVVKAPRILTHCVHSLFNLAKQQFNSRRVKDRDVREDELFFSGDAAGLDARPVNSACEHDEGKPEQTLTYQERKVRSAALHTISEVAEAYDVGLQLLKSERILGGPSQPAYYLMPCAVQRSRLADQSDLFLWADVPEFASLSDREKEVVSFLHEVITCHADEGASLELCETAPPYAGKNGSVGELTFQLRFGIEHLIDHEFDKEELEFGTPEEGLRVSTDAFEAAQYIFQCWR